MSPWSDQKAPGVWKLAVATIFTKVGVLIAVVGVAALALQIGWCRAQNVKLRASQAEADQAKARVEAVLREQGGTKGRLIKEREAHLTDKTRKFVEAVKKADPGARVSSTSSTKITIEDTDTGRVETAPDQPCPSSVEDTHHRFRFDLPSGFLRRQQSFRLDQVFVRGVNGAYRVQQTDFREFDPKTGDEIPSTGVRVEGSFEFVEEKAPGPGPWHLRGVAAVAYPFGFGAGVQVTPWKNLTLGPILLYQPATASRPAAGVAALGLGWRVFGSTISVGPFAGFSTDGGRFVGGATATIEVTR